MKIQINLLFLLNLDMLKTHHYNDDQYFLIITTFISSLLVTDIFSDAAGVLYFTYQFNIINYSLNYNDNNE